jgi:hypothetical protein
MSKPTPTPAKPEAQRTKTRAKAFTTATVVTFSLTLLAGSVAVLGNLVPLRNLSLGERVDVGAMLLVAPVVALVLAVVFEATRIALRREPLPAEPRRQPVVRWTPGQGEG